MKGVALVNRHAADRASATDDDVVSAARAGSPEAFAELHALYSRRLYRTILAITKNPQDADDALQDTFLRAYVAIQNFEGRSKIYSWLTRIAINSALSILRKQHTRTEVLFDDQLDPQLETLSFEVRDTAPNPEEAYDLNRRRLETLRAICSLDPQLRAPIRMRMMLGCSVREIGRALDLSESAVKARLYRARRRLSAAHNLSESELPLTWSV
ncbi:RNA polymerase sigma factor [Acidicapsa acidisoli]|uniref:RNA polymerase sigma factor n=1 Tax=Acidicapsa acidisoli TaxID=1615681 RepID=UPI0021E0374B|nr:sigma-70 family RNA polymerase sigma factor [Acidicapsa acidisoli]